MKLSSYFVISTAALVLNLLYVYSQYEQFYPTIVYLASDKISLTIFEEVMDCRTYCWAIAKTYCWAIAISR